MQDIVFTINGHPVSRSEMDNAVQSLSMEVHRKTMDALSPSELEEIRFLAVDKVIAKHLVYQQALASGVVASQADIAEEEERQMRNFPTEEEFYAKLDAVGIDRASFHRMLRQDLTVNRMTEAVLNEVPEPTPAQIEETYRLRSDRMVSPARVRASHILLRIKDGDRDGALALIEEIRRRAEDEDFALLAQESSQCPSAHLGGDLGYFRKGDMVKSFEEAAFSLPLGVVGGPVETQFGLHLIKVVDRVDEHPLDFEEAAPQVAEFLRQEARAQRLKEWVASLKEKAVIVHM